MEEKIISGGGAGDAFSTGQRSTPAGSRGESVWRTDSPTCGLCERRNSVRRLPVDMTPQQFSLNPSPRNQASVLYPEYLRKARALVDFLIVDGQALIRGVEFVIRRSPARSGHYSPRTRSGSPNC